jgi:hypothetical protein
VVDNEDVDGSVGRLELKAELTLEGSAEGRGGVADIWIGRPVPVKGEVVEADEAGLVSSTSQGRHSNSRYSRRIATVPSSPQRFYPGGFFRSTQTVNSPS